MPNTKMQFFFFFKFICSADENSYEINHNKNDESIKTYHKHQQDIILNNSQDEDDILLSKNPILYEIHYQPLKIGTVAPEYTKTAMTPQLLTRIHLFN